ncbi:MAG: heavy-metal-associated domain-containing protein [Pseudomonadota bacterium]|nr:heavy-metal-associated domain-containing protein [Pseudomonadota bacterium]
MIDFEINDMTCDHCRAAIVRAILGVDDAARVDVDMARHRVHIKTKEADLHRFGAAITVAGYTPMRIGTGDASPAAPTGGCSCAGNGRSCGMRLTDVGATTASSRRPAPHSAAPSASRPGCCSSRASTCRR